MRDRIGLVVKVRGEEGPGSAGVNNVPPSGVQVLLPTRVSPPVESQALSLCPRLCPEHPLPRSVAARIWVGVSMKVRMR